MNDFNNIFGQIFGQNPFSQNPFSNYKPTKKELFDMYIKDTINKKELDERMEKYYGKNNN